MDGSANTCSRDTSADTDGEGARLPYGIAPDGRLAHVSEVASGLACGCACPGCGGRLVAHKGPIRVHHFVHHVDRACSGAWETTLHLLAKEVVSEAREILLPEAVAQVGDLRQDVVAATAFRYEAVKTEVDMDGLRPDAVVTRGPRQLLLEFAVTHFCDDAKRAELRRRDLPAVEVDLSRVPRLASRAEHAEHILRTAPRRWLHNAKVAAEETRLRAIAEQQATAERNRRHRLYGKIANEVAQVWPAPPVPGHPSWLAQARDSGFGEFVGAAIPGDRCFAVDAATWQAAFLHFGAVSVAGQTFAAEAPLRYLQQREMLKEPFKLRRNWEPELVAFLRERVEGFQAPTEVLAAYADWLVERGLLTRTRKGWRADPERGRKARRLMDAAAAARRREADIGAVLKEVLGAMPMAAAVAAAWMDGVLAEFGTTPRDIVHRGGDRHDDLMNRLRALERMVRPGGKPVDGGLLGLPLEKVLRERRAEEAARNEAARREREEQLAQARERRRRESSEFVDIIAREAGALHGEAAGRSWIEETVRGATGLTFEEGRFEVGWQARTSIEAALRRERDRVEQAEEAERRRRAEEARVTAQTERFRRRLEDAALERFPGQQDKARLWLNSTQPALGTSPSRFCTDERTFERCMGLLDAAQPRGGRRR